MKFSSLIILNLILLVFYSCNQQKAGDPDTAINGERNGFNVSETVRNWPEASNKAAHDMYKKYGEPDEVSNHRLIWHNRGDFTEITVFREEIDHSFPMPHKDVLEHTIKYDVPSEKLADLASFNGSIILNRTKGTMSSRCENEYMNRLALNLAHEIAIEERPLHEAIEFFSHNVAGFLIGDTALIMHELFFTPPSGSGDAGEVIFDE